MDCPRCDTPYGGEGPRRGEGGVRTWLVWRVIGGQSPPARTASLRLASRRVHAIRKAEGRAARRSRAKAGPCKGSLYFASAPLAASGVPCRFRIRVRCSSSSVERRGADLLACLLELRSARLSDSARLCLAARPSGLPARCAPRPVAAACISAQSGFEKRGILPNISDRSSPARASFITSGVIRSIPWRWA